MPDLTQLIAHWGYGAIFLTVILGNVGLPVPEETVLVLAGYLVWQGQLRLPAVLAVGVASAVMGDNLGYWLGRRYGRDAIERYGHRAFVTPERFRKVWGFVTRYGAFAIFAARFVAGLRFLAGPLAGAAGIPPLTFTTANALGALLYVPYAVGLGYAVGYGLGDHIERLRRVFGRIEYGVLAGVILLTLAFVISRARCASRAQRGG